MPPEHAAHFDSLARQAYAARLGTWILLGSELLLFTAFLALYGGARAAHPAGFEEGVRHANVVIGTTNTIVLLVASYAVARAVHAIRLGAHRAASALLAVATGLALVFLALKGWEYVLHVREGALPGGRGAFFAAHPSPGIAAYFTLYWLATATHAVHVVIGAALLGGFAVACGRGAVRAEHGYRVALGGLYWHLVDLVWIVLWPLFYLVRGGG